MSHLKRKLDTIHKDGLTRKLQINPQPIDFSSNDYLGLANSSRFHSLFIDKVEKTAKQGSTGSRLLTGNSRQIENLESQIAQFHEADSALIYPSGYQANIGLLSCIASRGDTVIRDEYCHASIVDSLRLSFCNVVKFKHNDLSDLAVKMEKAKGEVFVVVEGLYSMDGDTADVAKISAMCKKQGAHLIVDEAHTGGVYGNNGQGIVHEKNVQNEVFARVLTYGKAFGYQGGAIIGSADLTKYLINKSRPFIYSTGISFHQIAGLSVAYQLVQEADEERKLLWNNVAYFSSLVARSSSKWMRSNSPIQALCVPGNAAVMEQSDKLKANEIIAMAIRSPTVSENQERIRACLHSYNTKEEIDALMKNVAI